MVGLLDRMLYLIVPHTLPNVGPRYDTRNRRADFDGRSSRRKLEILDTSFDSIRLEKNE